MVLFCVTFFFLKSIPKRLSWLARLPGRVGLDTNVTLESGGGGTYEVRQISNGKNGVCGIYCCGAAGDGAHGGILRAFAIKLKKILLH